ncbi:MAG: hypothetical protein ACRCX8_20300 [Sarcina sp.]
MKEIEDIINEEYSRNSIKFMSRTININCSNLCENEKKNRKRKLARKHKENKVFLEYLASLFEIKIK